MWHMEKKKIKLNFNADLLPPNAVLFKMITQLFLNVLGTGTRFWLVAYVGRLIGSYV